MDNAEAAKFRYLFLVVGSLLLGLGTALIDWRLTIIALGGLCLLQAVMNRLVRLLLLLTQEVRDLDL
jgi:hypothetical protein